jgi:hypothetical protein
MLNKFWNFFPSASARTSSPVERVADVSGVVAEIISAVATLGISGVVADVSGGCDVQGCCADVQGCCADVSGWCDMSGCCADVSGCSADVSGCCVDVPVCDCVPEAVDAPVDLITGVVDNGEDGEAD